MSNDNLYKLVAWGLVSVVAIIIIVTIFSKIMDFTAIQSLLDVLQ